MTDSSNPVPEPGPSASGDDTPEITDLIKANSRHLSKAALPAAGAAVLAAFVVAMARKGRKRPNDGK